MKKNELLNDQHQKFVNYIQKEYIEFFHNPTRIDTFSSIYDPSKEFLLQKHFEPILETYIKSIVLNDTLIKLFNSIDIQATQCNNDKFQIGEFILNVNQKKILCRFNNFEYDISRDDYFDQIITIYWNKTKSIKTNSKYHHISYTNFISHFFGIEFLENFVIFTTSCYADAEDLIGIKTVPTLSNNLLSSFRFKVEESIFQYITNFENNINIDKKIKEISNDISFNYAYQVLNKHDSNKIIKLEENSKKLVIDNNLIKKFYEGNYVRLLLGNSDIFKSLSTSEYMYLQHEEDYCLDYTAIVSGYLKSIEQLLYKIISFRLDEPDFDIKYNNAKDKNNTKPITHNHKKKNHIQMVDFTSDNLPYMDTTLGSMKYFLNDKTHLIN